jgi:spermidine/putrescine transport system ATP-binding protein
MLSIRNLCQTWNSELNWTLQEISFDVRPGELISLLGPSGCGKTTLLRCLAGFVMPQRGDILFEGSSLLHIPVSQRPFHMVFQKSALFPHLSVFENVAFSLRLKKWSEQKIKDRVLELLQMMQLEPFKEAFPSSLSGGQSQRVALARALADGTQFLLLDEPFSALDAKQRERLQMELLNIQKNLNTTLIMVTHDQSEAMSLSTRIVLLNNSKIEQIGTPQELYAQPKTAFAAEFIGHKNKIFEDTHEVHYLASSDFHLNVNSGALKFKVLLNSIYDLGPQLEARVKYNEYDWKLHFPRSLESQIRGREYLELTAPSEKVLKVNK